MGASRKAAHDALAYDAIGGVEGALARRAQAIFDSATQRGDDATSVALFRRLFTRLVTLGEGAEDTRRIVGREELGPDAWALAQKLAGEDNRLVVTAAPAGQETAEVVHEALIRNWPALVDWVNRDRAFQTWLRQLKPRVDEWRANPSDEGTLLRGGPLAVAEDWLVRRGGDVNEEEKAFIAASVAARDAEKRRPRRTSNGSTTARRDGGSAGENGARAAGRALGAWGDCGGRGSRGCSIRWAILKPTLELKAGQAQLAEAQSALKAGQAKFAHTNWRSRGAKRASIKQQSAVSELQRSLESKQLELRHQHANLLGELANVQWAQGNPDAALRLRRKAPRTISRCRQSCDLAAASASVASAWPRLQAGRGSDLRRLQPRRVAHRHRV